MRGTQGKRIEFLEAREDTTEAFESAEETFALVALLVNGMIVVPGMQAVVLRRNDGLRSVVFRAPVPSANILIDSFLSDNPPRDKGWSCYLTGENSTQRGDR